MYKLRLVSKIELNRKINRRYTPVGIENRAQPENKPCINSGWYQKAKQPNFKQKNRPI
jgi:hypothetical protein